jgi:hypothetical protein
MKLAEIAQRSTGIQSITFLDLSHNDSMMSSLLLFLRELIRRNKTITSLCLLINHFALMLLLLLDHSFSGTAPQQLDL